ncbi:MAG: hypothetical protein JO332_10870 [Planctomycetaceae bacterium]|nr:hypothetical protein [Planctomycetaceae bacterium]
MKIADLDPAQLARHAENVFLFQGRHQACARLSVHALRLDPNQPLALRTLSDMLTGDQLKESGMEQFSAAVLEYALRPASPLNADDRALLENHLFLAKWSWAFVKRLDGQTTCTWDELQNRALFREEKDRYREFLDGILAPSRSIEGAFRAAWTLGGVMGRLLVHRSLGVDAPIEEVFFPDRFVEAPAYAEWLASSADPLDTLERERQRRTRKAAQSPDQTA